MRISDWSSDVCSSDLAIEHDLEAHALFLRASPGDPVQALRIGRPWSNEMRRHAQLAIGPAHLPHEVGKRSIGHACGRRIGGRLKTIVPRSEGHTSELQSLMRISYAVFCLKKKKKNKKVHRLKY